MPVPVPARARPAGAAPRLRRLALNSMPLCSAVPPAGGTRAIVYSSGHLVTLRTCAQPQVGPGPARVGEIYGGTESGSHRSGHQHDKCEAQEQLWRGGKSPDTAVKGLREVGTGARFWLRSRGKPIRKAACQLRLSKWLAFGCEAGSGNCMQSEEKVGAGHPPRGRGGERGVRWAWPKTALRCPQFPQHRCRVRCRLCCSEAVTMTDACNFPKTSTYPP